MIDIHSHPFMIKELVEDDPLLEHAIRDVFGLLFPPQPLKTFFLEMDAANIERAVLLPIDCTTAHHCQVVTNEKIAELASQTDRFIGFASVDPNCEDAPRSLERAIQQYGLRGLKLDPALQQFDPGDMQKAYPLYQVCVDLDIPVMIHFGLSWAPLGRSMLAHPGVVEDIARQFPSLRIIIPHLGWPWHREAVMVALKFQNVYLDTSIIYSGTPKQAMEQVMIQEIGPRVFENSLIRQTVFGTNYPRQDMRRAARGIQALGFSPQLIQAMCETNANTLLGR